MLMYQKLEKLKPAEKLKVKAMSYASRLSCKLVVQPHNPNEVPGSLNEAHFGGIKVDAHGIFWGISLSELFELLISWLLLEQVCLE